MKTWLQEKTPKTKVDICAMWHHQYFTNKMVQISFAQKNEEAADILCHTRCKDEGWGTFTSVEQMWLG